MVLRIGAACTHEVSHLEGGNIESPVDEDPGDSLRAGRSAKRSLIRDEAEGFWEQELQAQVLKKVGIICADSKQCERVSLGRPCVYN